jgi:pimeloyl-ACP methyl ester carboxylesterase
VYLFHPHAPLEVPLLWFWKCVSVARDTAAEGGAPLQWLRMMTAELDSAVPCANADAESTQNSTLLRHLQLQPDVYISSVAARNPSRPHTWLRRNVLHNTVQRAEDEVWIWRYERYPRRHPRRCAFAALWDQLGATTAPTLLIRGTHSRMVDGSDEAELRRRLPTARVEHVQGAGHCVQSDQPLRLAALLDEFVQVPTAGAAHVPVQCRDLRIDLKCIEACQGL